MARELDADALRALEAAVDAAPTRVTLGLQLVQGLLAAGRIEDARRRSDTLVSVAPDDPEVLTLAAGVAKADGDVDRADRLLRLAAALDNTTQPSAGADSQPPEGSRGGAVPLSILGRDDGDGNDADFERPDMTLSDVGGMEQVKRRLNAAFLAPLHDAKLRAAFGKRLRGGLLLYGPPGCGKTYIARATAGELRARFISVGLTDILDPVFGRTEHALHDVFVRARQKAPCVLFFDELDALGQRRSLVREQAFSRRLAAQFLTELDGIDNDNEGVFVLAATNHPWDVDSALRRPGRFDRLLLVLPPDGAARETILRANLVDRPVDPELNLERLVKATERFSGADLAHLVESAAERALLASIDEGAIRPISQADFTAVLTEVRPSTLGWFQQARQHALFANEGGMYDELLRHITEQGLA